ncbi:MAG: hydroxysqualene dehydroxylase HpnE [Gammaproteobacteria bacterium]|nr:hydroxysqualene dehydroxylase HpnE [Gammaproteobacteria bacterium]MDH5652114.1 hydroxysqualene dehydroxylase HpnE [Gammaproteobacteria bacterium]
MAATESTGKLTRSHVIIIGAGWAGLAAAVALSRAGVKITLLESARQVGGRARRVAFNKLRVDNGQHLLIGAYQQTLQLMSSLNINIDEKFIRESLQLTLRDQQGNTVFLSTPRLLVPLHLLVALLKSKGLSLSERMRAIQFGVRLFMHGFKFRQDMSVAELMVRYKQPAGLCRKFWYPLCIAIMNTPPERASAQVFLRVLHDSFRQNANHSDLLYTRADLSSLFPDPAIEYIEKQGGSIRLGQRVTGLQLDEKSGRINAVAVDEQILPADHVIIATPAHACANLLKDIPGLQPLSGQLAKLSYEPIVTAYLQYPESVRMPHHMLGMLDTTTQWLFDRRIYGQAGLLAAVISSNGPHMEQDNEVLGGIISGEIARLFPDWPAPEDMLIIREKRATFACEPGINTLRPPNNTTIDGLWLAGDYTNTGYPATLEGAVQSGLQCAARIIETLPN